MFTLIDLPFAQDALAPAMSADTLATHHGKHHAAYVKNTNTLLAERGKTPKSLEEVVRESFGKDQPLFNQSAQVWNHGFFWLSLSPTQKSISGALGDAIAASFGSQDAFREQFLKQGGAHFASGWIWLLADKAGKLSLSTTPNANTPVADGSGAPVLVCDLWEHAYYLDHKNDRAAFLKAFFDKLANWDFAARQYDAAMGKGAAWTYPAPSA